MKKLQALICLAVVLLAGCSSSGVTGGNVHLSDASITMARATARTGLTILLESKGVEPALATAITGSIHAAVDALIAKKGLATVLDAEAWPPLRAKARSELSAELLKATVNGKPLFDQAGADAVTEDLIATFEAVVREYLASQPAPPVTSSSSGS